MEIADGIHSIDGIRVANCYLVVGVSGLMLIDAGIPGSGRKIIRYVEKLGRKPAEISVAVFTHNDVDHIGGAAEVRRLAGAKLAIHEADAPTLSGAAGFRPEAGFRGKALTVLARVMGFRPAKPDIALRDGMDIAGFKTVHTPGHTAGSVCLHLPGKMIFTGDTVLADSQGNPMPPDRRLATDVREAMASLARISELDYDILLPGHGAPVIGKASVKVKELVRRLK